ncbi:PEX11-domain-containing protein [Piedraia hortae CBS 480.64]|uniref:PEX11-domain-containing protein n=1 Tax=Piedraia hortae CBS 480.64 TaxID=1314780 RepID=A0A6A7BZZ2_9PEZI|nr:PEX11-domain-containing protein [Piedraia hortae CBS 480.64]
MALVYHPAVGHFNRFVATTVGRDKALRTVQYISRFLAWYTYRTNRTAETVAIWEGIKKNFGTVRKAMRIGKFVEHLTAAAQAADAKGSDEILKALAVARQLGYATYLALDSFTYLHHTGIRPLASGKRLATEAYRAWFVGILCSVVAGAYKLNVMGKAQYANEKGDEVVERKKLDRLVYPAR